MLRSITTAGFLACALLASCSHSVVSRSVARSGYSSVADDAEYRLATERVETVSRTWILDDRPGYGNAETIICSPKRLIDREQLAENARYVHEAMEVEPYTSLRIVPGTLRQNGEQPDRPPSVRVYTDDGHVGAVCLDEALNNLRPIGAAQTSRPLH